MHNRNRFDSYFLGAIELSLVTLTGLGMALVKYLERRAKRRLDIIEVERTGFLFNRVHSTINLSLHNSIHTAYTDRCGDAGMGFCPSYQSH